MTAGLQILVVEDDPDVRECLREVLEDAGYVVTTAHDGDEALARLAQPPRPAVMLIDFVMPGMSGQELIRACGASPELAEIPVVIISGQRFHELEVTAAHGFLPKPFAGDEVLEAIARAIGRREK
jgi:two-component system phosphate regulon response regulator PhoB